MGQVSSSSPSMMSGVAFAADIIGGSSVVAVLDSPLVGRSVIFVLASISCNSVALHKVSLPDSALGRTRTVTRGIESKTARAIPFALYMFEYCMSLFPPAGPSGLGRPYLSGCLCTLMAPEIITKRNRNATMPVSEYRMAMATVEPDGFPEFVLLDVGIAVDTVRASTIPVKSPDAVALTFARIDSATVLESRVMMKPS